MDNIKRKTWKIWEKNPKVEERTFKRVKKILPEMESTKQLVNILKPIYKKNMKILDVGCAAGHYYLGLMKLDDQINYTGVDATKNYINFAKRMFKKKENVSFYKLSIYDLIKKNFKKHDIVFCCNLILHLPEIKKALNNLLHVTKKHLIVRTLISSPSSITKRLLNYKFDKNGEPLNFVYQNNWSQDYIKSLVKNYDVHFIKDKFDPKNINKEYRYWKNIQGSNVTKIISGKQISGPKIFDWKWFVISKP